MIEKTMKRLLFIISIVLLLFLFYQNDFGLTGRINHLQVSEEEYQ